MHGKSEPSPALHRSHHSLHAFPAPYTSLLPPPPPPSTIPTTTHRPIAPPHRSCTASTAPTTTQAPTRLLWVSSTRTHLTARLGASVRSSASSSNTNPKTLTLTPTLTLTLTPTLTLNTRSGALSSSWRSVSTCSRPTARMSYSSLNASRQFTSSSWCLLHSPSQHHTRTFPLTHILTRPYPNPLRTLTSFQSSFHPHPTHTLTHHTGSLPARVARYRHAEQRGLLALQLLHRLPAGALTD